MRKEIDMLTKISSLNLFNDRTQEVRIHVAGSGIERAVLSQNSLQHHLVILEASR